MCIGGCCGLFSFLEKIISSVLRGLKVTNHFVANACTFAMSELSISADTRGFSTIT